MSVLRKPVVFCAFILIIMSLFATCDDSVNPFKSDLGPKVVVEPPTINVDFPVSGSFLTGTVIFTGTAKAYIQVKKVEVKILKGEDQNERPWTDKGIILTGSNLKNKTWTYKFDSSQFNSQKDGLIRMMFRVYDTTPDPVESIELVYIIKNNPSDVKMSAPDNTMIIDPASVPKIAYKGEIQGQIIDRRGLRPGYPQIKLWPDKFLNDAKHNEGNHKDGEEPPDDDPQWGWASLFLPGNGDDIQKEITEGSEVKVPAGKGKYANRSNMTVVRAAQFSMRLAEYTIKVEPDTNIASDPNFPHNPDDFALRKIEYVVDENGRQKPFDPGRIFNFKIRTMDTSSNSLDRMVPTYDGPFIKGYFPPQDFGTAYENAFEPRREQEYVKVLIFSSDARPSIEIDNYDKTEEELKSKPNPWITETTARKIALGNTSKPDFRLQLLIKHPTGIQKVVLKYEHESSGRWGYLTWDAGPDGIVHPEGNPYPPDPDKGFLFTFTAWGGMKDLNLIGDPPNQQQGPGYGKEIFTTSSEPYILTAIVWDISNMYAESRYVVYMDGKSPDVSIRSVRGADSEPTSAAAADKDIPGGVVNDSPYVVNGNIQVVVDRTDEFGIMAYKSNSDMGAPPSDVSSSNIDGYPMVKWYIELAGPSGKTDKSPARTDTMLEKLLKYKTDPSWSNLQFFININDTRSPIDASGWVRRPLNSEEAKNDADKAHHFKINTTPWDEQYLWLYVIAQDQTQNLGFIAQKIYVDQSTDKPKLDLPALYKENAAKKPIMGQDGNLSEESGEGLDVNVNWEVTGTTATRKMSGNWSADTPRRNILERDQGIELNLRDDDGIDLEKDGLVIRLTILDPVTDVPPESRTVTIDKEMIIKDLVKSNYAKNKRDISLTLSQEIMAKALNILEYDEESKTYVLKKSLNDGLYKIEIILKDDINAKVAIEPPLADGDTPVTAYTADSVGPDHVETYFFAVSTEMPKVVIDYPDENAWGSDQPIVIRGSVRSRLNVRSAWITFTPNVIAATSTNPNPPSIPYKITLSPAAAVAGTDGYYSYTWEFKGLGDSADGVVFNPKNGATAIFNSEVRRFTVEAYDRLGNMGNEVRAVQIDVTPPDVTLVDFNYGRPQEQNVTYLYGKVSFTVSASDANGLYEAEENGVMMSGIKWWVLPADTTVEPSWNSDYPEYPAAGKNPSISSMTGKWTGGGNFTLNQSSGGRYTWIIDTRYLEQDKEYKLYLIALDKAGNQSRREITLAGQSPIYTSAFETFTVDQNRDYPTIDENSLDPLQDSPKLERATISGTVSDADFFNPAKRNTPNPGPNGPTYVQIRFPKVNADGKPLVSGIPGTSDWEDWISIKIPDTYSSANGGIDPSGAIVYKFKASDRTDPANPASPFVYTGAAADYARTYLDTDGIKYYQIRVTDEPVGPTDEKDKGKWYGKNPDYFMTVDPDKDKYPGYNYVYHDKVSRIFPLENKKKADDRDAYSFIVDSTWPAIFFDNYDPTPPTVDTPRPGYTDFRPTFSSADLLIAALTGYVQEYKLSDMSMSWSVKDATGKDVTFRKAILKDPPDPATVEQYPWNLTTLLSVAEKAALKQVFDAAAQGNQIIVFEATDMVQHTTRVSYVFAKDTQGPEINFNITRAIKRSTTNPPFPTANGETAAKWALDWRYGGTTWQTAWDQGWRDIIENWPSEYAFKITADVMKSLVAENGRIPSTVIGDPEPDPANPVPTGYSPPVVDGTFNDLYSPIRIAATSGNLNPKTYFYYRFKNSSGTKLDMTNISIPTPPATELDIQKVNLTYKANPPLADTEINYSWLTGYWIRKEIEKSPVDAAGNPTQNEKEANWRIILDNANGFYGTDGENWVDIWVKDTAGNISDIYNVRFFVDRTDPVLGEEPNPFVDPADPTKGRITDAEEFIIDEISALGTSWKNQTKDQKRLPEIQRVFSADGSTNDDNMAFTLQGTVSDYNFNGMTIVLGQENYGYTVTSKLSENLTTAGTWDIKDDDNATTSRLTIVKETTITGYDGAPLYTWTYQVRNRDVKELRYEAKDASDSTRRYIRVTASDKANKRVGPVDWFFYLDTKKPYLEYTNLDPGRFTDAASFEGSNLALSGLVSDDTRIKDVQYMIGRWDYSISGDDNTVNKWRWWDSGTSTWTLQAPIAVGLWPSVFSDTKDATGKITTYNPTRQSSMNWVINQATIDAAPAGKFENTAQKKLFDQEGYYRLELYITDFSLGNGNPHNTTVVYDPEFKDTGKYNEAAEGHSIGDSNTYNTVTGAGFRSGRVFYIDKKDPKLEWDSTIENKTYFRNEDTAPNVGKVIFRFVAGDGNTLKNWTAVIKDKAGNILEITTGTVVKWDAGKGTTSDAIAVPNIVGGSSTIEDTSIEERTYEIKPFMTADASPGGTPLDVYKAQQPNDDGTLPIFTITITVTDGANRTSSISKQFTLDNTPPEFVKEKYLPLSYKRGTDDKPANAEGDPLRSYSYDAVTGKMIIRGNTTDNSNQIAKVSYYVVNNTDTPDFNKTDGAAVTFPTPKWITDNNKWRYSGGAGNNSSIITTSDNTTVLMEIDEGTFAWRIMVPQTSLFTSDSSAGAYVQTAQTGGIGIDKGTYTATAYNDVLSISENSVTMAGSPGTPTKQPVPKLTFPGLANKTIYGGEQVALLTVYVRAEDMAGNVSYDLLKYWIWPEGDRPIVTSINNPNGERDANTGELKAPESDRLLNGTIRLSGMAKDNERVKNVWFRVLPSTNGVVAAGAVPYTLKIPVWDDDWNATSAYQTAVNDNTSPFTTGGYIGARRKDDPGPTATTPPAQIGGGWYMANGGNSPEVSWWVYINTEGELDPKNGESKKEFTVQVRAQDVTYDDKNDKWMDYTNTWRGMASVPMSVHAWVVADLPTFDTQRIAPVASDVAEAGETTPPKYWEAIENLSIRNRSSYKVTVKHDLGLGAIRWSPTQWFVDSNISGHVGAFRANPAADPFNLLDINPMSYPAYAPGQTIYLNPAGNGYLVGTKAAALAEVAAGRSGMAVTVTITERNDGVPTKCDVFVDINADVLLDKMTTDDPDYGINDPDHPQYNPNATGRAGQVVGSVRYPVYLSASDVSKATPLTARGDALLPIDNLDPYGMYTLNRKPAGTAVTIGGEAGDKGPVNGIARVVMWFQRKDGNFISWHETHPEPETELQAVTDFRTNNGTNGPDWWNTISVGAGGVIPANVSKPYIPPTVDGTNGDYAIVVDTNSPSKGVTRWGHTLPMGFADGGIGKIWYVQINSYGIKSGPVELHFVVIDKAGNAKYYKERLIIMNNVAVIDRLKLATDIRHQSSWTGGTPSLAINNPAASGKKFDDKTSTGTWPILKQIRDKVPLDEPASEDPNNDVKKGITEWISASVLGAGKVIDFNVRNNLFAMRVETTKSPASDKTRNFRLEYVSSARLLSDTNAAGTRLINMQAGRVYVINDPGTARWGAVGAEGDGPWQRGYAFIAVVNGQETDENNKLVDKITGTGSVWELNYGYPAIRQQSNGSYSQNGIPPVLQLADATYTTANYLDAQSAEFVYANAAFGTDPDAAPGNSIVDNTGPNDADWPPAAGVNPVTGKNYSLFILRVFDGAESDLFGDFTILRVRVNNNDKTKPFAQLYDLNPKTEGQERTAIAQTNSQDDLVKEERYRVSPMFIGEGTGSNRTMGGLWNISPKPDAIDKPGHIEPRRVTTYTTAQEPYRTQQHSLSSAQMGGAATSKDASITNPFADPAGFFTTDTVSGRVVLRGYAEDDQRVQRVRLVIGSQNIDILDYPSGGTVAATPANNTTYTSPKTGMLAIPDAQNGKVYYTDTIDLYRHRVEWAYIWDTETIPAGTVVGNVSVRVISYPRSGAFGTTPKTDEASISANTPAPGSPHVNTPNLSDSFEKTRPNTSPFNPGFPVNLNKYNSITVNLRPYITGFLRNKAQFSNNTRSRQGRYMFYRGENAVVKGFNLGTGTMTISINGTALSAPVNVETPGNYDITTDTAILPVVTRNMRYRQFTVGTSTITGNGLVTYTAGGQNAVNTSSTERTRASGTPVRPQYIQPWNIEYSAGIDGSTLWDDFTQAHIWQSNDTTSGGDNGRFPKGGNNMEVFDPSMSIDPATGTLWTSHNEGGGNGSNTGSVKIGNNSSNTCLVIAAFVDPIINSDIFISTRQSGYNTNNNAFTVWAAYSIIGKTGGGTSWSSFGGVFVNGPNGGNAGLTSGLQNAANNNGFNATGDSAARGQYLAESTYYNSQTNIPNGVPQLNQFKNPHVISDYRDNNEHIHVSYYDTKDGSVKYRYNRRGSPDTVSSTSAPKAWTNLDGGFDQEDQDALSAAGPFPSVSANGRIVNYNTRSGVAVANRPDVGEYNSIALTSSGSPVVAYYDRTNQKLKIIISSNTIPVAATNWGTPQDVIASGDIKTGTGEYVSMRIDTRVTPNVVHIAAMNSLNKNLVYIKGTISGTTFTVSKDSNNKDIIQVVDSVGSVGRWCSLSLDSSGNPWIAYQDEGYQGARDGVKLAYYNTDRYYKGSATYRSGEDVDINFVSVSGWEAMHVPTQFRVENARVGMECYPVRNPQTFTGTAPAKFWRGAVGYLGQDYFRAAYYVE